jgi:hypothetical protein
MKHFDNARPNLLGNLKPSTGKMPTRGASADSPTFTIGWCKTLSEPRVHQNSPSING